MFSPLSVCLFVSLFGRIQMKFCGQVVSVTRKKLFDFGKDQDPDPDLIIFK